MKFLLSLE